MNIWERTELLELRDFLGRAGTSICYVGGGGGAGRCQCEGERTIHALIKPELDYHLPNAMQVPTALETIPETTAIRPMP